MLEENYFSVWKKPHWYLRTSYKSYSLDQRAKSEWLDHSHQFLVWIFLRENRTGSYNCHQYISPSWLLHLTSYFYADPQPLLFPSLCLLFSSCILLLLVLFPCVHLSFSAVLFLLLLFFFPHISLLLYLLSFFFFLSLTTKIPKSTSAAATQLLLLAATGTSSAQFAGLDGSTVKASRKQGFEKTHSSKQCDPRGCIWIVCYKTSTGERYKLLPARPWLPP